jgi:hypothetical protein
VSFSVRVGSTKGCPGRSEGFFVDIDETLGRIFNIHCVLQRIIFVDIDEALGLAHSYISRVRSLSLFLMQQAGVTLGARRY